MGLFSGTTKIYVASSAFNLAGEHDARLKVIPNIMLQAVTRPNGRSIGETLRDSLLGSTAMSQRRFFRWASTNYDLGMPTVAVSLDQQVDPDLIRAELRTQLGLTADEVLFISAAVIDSADEQYWAEDYVNTNRPAALDDSWTPEYKSATQTIEITFGPGDVESFAAPADFLWGIGSPQRRLLFVSYQIMTKDPVTQMVTAGDAQLFTYGIGQGNATFDTLQSAASAPLAEFFPALPVWLNNASALEKPYADNLRLGYKRLSGGQKIEDLVTQIETNESVGDMDHAFVVLGVSLNTKDRTGQLYMYEFFKELINVQASQNWATIAQAGADKDAASTEFRRWLTAHSMFNYTHPFYGLAAPNNVTAFESGKNTLNLTMPGLSQFDMRLKWAEIVETQHLGNAGVIERTGGTALPVGGMLVQHKDISAQSVSWLKLDGNNGKLEICHQLSKTRYRKITVYGLSHENRVYETKSVTITAKEALGDLEESGFLVPLHHPTMRKMSLAKQAQLASANTYLIVNSYKVVKQKWWQTGIFKIFIVIAGIALAAFTGGGSLAASAGILGTNIAVGTLLGATGLTAVLVGAAANAIAGMILATFITKASTAIFGERAGQIIAAIATVVAMGYASNYAATGKFAMDWSQFMKAENLQKLTNAVAQGYSNILKQDAYDIQQEALKISEEYEDAMREIEELSSSVLGMTSTGIDGMMFANAGEYFGESRNSFLSRTLLTGSDIAELSLGMIEKFAEISLELPLAPT